MGGFTAERAGYKKVIAIRLVVGGLTMRIVVGGLIVILVVRGLSELIVFKSAMTRNQCIHVFATK